MQYFSQYQISNSCGVFPQRNCSDCILFLIWIHHSYLSPEGREQRQTTCAEYHRLSSYLYYFVIKECCLRSMSVW